MDSVTQIQIMEKFFGILIHANAFGKGVSFVSSNE